MILFIDTTGVEDIFVALVDGRGDFLVKKKVKAKYKQSEKLLVTIHKITEITRLQNHKDKIKGIIVVKGPGSFTALRIGVATANALGYGMGVSVVGVKKGEGEEVGSLVKKGLKGLERAKKAKRAWVAPEYGKEPNITIKR